MDGEIVLTVLAGTLALIGFCGIRLLDRRKGSWDRRNGEIRGNGGRRASDRAPAPAMQRAPAGESQAGLPLALEENKA